MLVAQYIRKLSYGEVLLGIFLFIVNILFLLMVNVAITFSAYIDVSFNPYCSLFKIPKNNNTLSRHHPKKELSKEQNSLGSP